MQQKKKIFGTYKSTVNLSQSMHFAFSSFLKMSLMFLSKELKMLFMRTLALLYQYIINGCIHAADAEAQAFKALM